MKATKDQYQFIESALKSELAERLSHFPSLDAGKITLSGLSMRACWLLLHRAFAKIEDDRPIGCGTARHWKLAGLHDSHIVTVFKKIQRDNR